MSDDGEHDSEHDNEHDGEDDEDDDDDEDFVAGQDRAAPTGRRPPTGAPRPHRFPWLLLRRLLRRR
jgi:hypothetical protein